MITQTETKHTPGPWSYNREEGGYQGHFISTGDCIICDLPDAEDFLSVKQAAPHTAANARLIAAAPDLLEALSAILQDVKRRKYKLAENITDFVMQTIAKAEGR